MNRKRLIEVSLPLAKISEQVVREKAIRRGHISSLHTWWARRPQTLMRALIFASLLPEPETKEERYELDTLLENLLEMESAADERNPALQTAIQLVQESFPNELPRLLDPFMGSGTTGVEALRLGCETHAVDLNPVAYLIQLGALVFPKQFAPNNGLTQSALLTYDKIAYPTLSEAIRRWGAWVGKEVEKELGHLYKNPIGDEPINAYLWARTVQCPNPTCGVEVPLVRQWWLAKKKGLMLKPLIDPQSHEITFTIVPYDEIKKSSFDPNTGSIFRGTATCLVCKQALPTTYIHSEAHAKRLGARPLVVIDTQKGKGKTYRLFTPEDALLWQQAQELAVSYGSELPDEPLDGFEQLKRYGFTQWQELFNARQGLTLIFFTRRIAQVYETMCQEGNSPTFAKAITTYLALALDGLINYSSQFSTWNRSNETVTNVFISSFMMMTWDYIEINPFSPLSVNWRGRYQAIADLVEKLSGQINEPATVTLGTATRLPYSDEYFHLVVADPPYYDNVPYASLSNFYYVWLKRSLKHLYPELFQKPLVTQEEDLTTRRSSNIVSLDTDDNYLKKLQASFQESARVLQPEGIFVLLYWPEHWTTAGWQPLFTALRESNLLVQTVWPLRTERPSLSHSTRLSAICIVCRKQTEREEATHFLRVRAYIRAEVRKALWSYQEQQMPPEDWFVAALGPALAIWGKYRAVYSDDNEPVTAAAIIDVAQEELFEYGVIRDDPSTSKLSYLEVRAFIRHRVREKLSQYEGQDFWNTAFFVQRVDLAAEAFDYQSAKKPDDVSVNIYELLGIVEEEFWDFIWLQDNQFKILTSDTGSQLVCDNCSKEFRIVGELSCPYCHQLFAFQISQLILADLKARLTLEKDPIRKRVQAVSESWLVDSSYEKIVTVMETLFKQLNTYCYRLKQYDPKKLPRRNYFQNIDDSEKWCADEHQISIFGDLDKHERDNLEVIVLKRHVLAHNNGIKDETYVKKRGEDLSEVGQPIVVTQQEAIKGITILEKVIQHCREQVLPLKPTDSNSSAPVQ